MNGCSWGERYNTYPTDTRCVGEKDDTGRTIGAMQAWYDRAKDRMSRLDPPVRQEDLMPVFGVTTRGAVGHYLRGRREPSVTALVKLADRLGMSLDELLKGSPSGVREPVPTYAETSQPQRLQPDNVILTVRTLQVVLGRRGVELDLTNPIHAELFCEVYQEAVALPDDDPAAAAALGATVVELAQKIGRRSDERGKAESVSGAGRGGGERKRAT